MSLKPAFLVMAQSRFRLDGKLSCFSSNSFKQARICLISGAVGRSTAAIELDSTSNQFLCWAIFPFVGALIYCWRRMWHLAARLQVGGTSKSLRLSAALPGRGLPCSRNFRGCSSNLRDRRPATSSTSIYLVIKCSQRSLESLTTGRHFASHRFHIFRSR
jgi:hypothetical protein